MAAKADKQTTQPPANATKLAKIAGYVRDDPGAHQKLLNDRVRLGILSCLAVSASLSFKELKNLLDVTDGILSVHARKLEDAGLVQVTKQFEGRTPKTEFQIAPEGRQALERHLAHMEALIQATQNLKEP